MGPLVTQRSNKSSRPIVVSRIKVGHYISKRVLKGVVALFATIHAQMNVYHLFLILNEILIIVTYFIGFVLTVLINYAFIG